MKTSETGGSAAAMAWNGAGRKIAGYPSRSCAEHGIPKYVCLEIVCKSRKSHGELFVASGNLPLHSRSLT